MSVPWERYELADDYHRSVADCIRFRGLTVQIASVLIRDRVSRAIIWRASTIRRDAYGLAGSAHAWHSFNMVVACTKMIASQSWTILVQNRIARDIKTKSWYYRIWSQSSTSMTETRFKFPVIFNTNTIFSRIFSRLESCASLIQNIALESTRTLI